ncbi:MAG: 50S ribosomal protein L3 [Patescibacteria group bacterium]
MKFILGKKIEMTQLYDNNGGVIPVTMVEAGRCMVTQVKTADKDSYNSVQIGFGKKKNLSKALKSHLKGLEDYRWLREFRFDKQPADIKRGDIISVNTFNEGEKIKITGISKGKGFQGVVKRHGFKGHHKTHGNKDQERMPGSIGAGGPARVFKGMRMPGHMGNDRVTVKNLEIIKIDEENNILYLKGAVPGRRESLLLISGDGDLKVNLKKQEEKRKEEPENSNQEKNNQEAKTEAQPVEETNIEK